MLKTKKLKVEEGICFWKKKKLRFYFKNIIIIIIFFKKRTIKQARN